MLIDRRTLLRGTAALAAGKALGLVGPRQAKAQEPGTIRVRIWSEGTAPASVYPEDIDGALASALERHPSLRVQRALQAANQVDQAAIARRLRDAPNAIRDAISRERLARIQAAA